MPQEKQNGLTPPLPIPEGDLYLFVRINPKNNEFQILFSDLVTALALHRIADAHLDGIVRGSMAPQVQLPGRPMTADEQAFFRKHRS